MAVCAPHVAFCDLSPDVAQRAQISHHCTDCCPFDVADMVEIKHAVVGFAAVDARMLREVSQYLGTAFGSLSGDPVRDATMVRTSTDTRDMRRTIDPLARLANTMPSRLRLVAKAEFVNRFQFTTTSAPLHTRIVSNACASVVASCARISRARSGAPGGNRTPIVPLRRRMPYPLDHGRSWPIAAARCGRRVSALCANTLGMTGFEPATSASQTQRSTKLSYIPQGSSYHAGKIGSSQFLRSGRSSCAVSS